MGGLSLASRGLDAVVRWIVLSKLRYREQEALRPVFVCAIASGGEVEVVGEEQHKENKGRISRLCKREKRLDLSDLSIGSRL